jgi:hypothetical protein
MFYITSLTLFLYVDYASSLFIMNLLIVGHLKADHN